MNFYFLYFFNTIVFVVRKYKIEMNNNLKINLWENLYDRSLYYFGTYFSKYKYVQEDASVNERFLHISCFLTSLFNSLFIHIVYLFLLLEQSLDSYPSRPQRVRYKEWFMRRWDKHEKICILFQIYVDMNLGKMSMGINRHGYKIE